MGQRRQAREAAIQILFMCDFTEQWNFERALFTFNHFEFQPTIRTYAEALVHGVVDQIEKIDSQITRSSDHWSINRMARVDRAILRLASFELMYLADEVPKSVAINEAIEIAKRYGSDESPNFVNGVLDRLGALVRPGEVKVSNVLKLAVS